MRRCLDLDYGVRMAAGHGEQLQSTSSVVFVRGHHVYKNVWTPSIGERLQLRRQDDYDDHAVSVAREGRDNSRPRSPRDVTHILELHYAWWERRMRDNRKEDARQMRDNEKEDARKRGGGADKRGGAHSEYQFFRCGKIGGGGGG